MKSVEASLLKFKKYQTELCEQEYNIRSLIQAYHEQNDPGTDEDRGCLQQAICDVSYGSHQPTFDQKSEGNHAAQQPQQPESKGKTSNSTKHTPLSRRQQIFASLADNQLSSSSSSKNLLLRANSGKVICASPPQFACKDYANSRPKFIDNQALFQPSQFQLGQTVQAVQTVQSVQAVQSVQTVQTAVTPRIQAQRQPPSWGQQVEEMLQQKNEQIQQLQKRIDNSQKEQDLIFSLIKEQCEKEILGI